ncbi:MAG: penicillin-binding transpeptidase domain-containing protein, partial [Nitrospirota bacterium]|nr:penicillin-binding transpeptidase domain-containing protein [Nitrospirota bacterium]
IIALKPENIKLVKDALMGVVSEGSGTGKAARSAMVSIGGKTGTSQVIGGDTGRAGLDARFRDHAWFVAFAPEFNPRIAVAVFAEHGGHGATAAAPVAKKVIEAYYRVKAEDQGPQVADH